MNSPLPRPSPRIIKLGPIIFFRGGAGGKTLRPISLRAMILLVCTERNVLASYWIQGIFFETIRVKDVLAGSMVCYTYENQNHYLCDDCGSDFHITTVA